MSPENSRSFLRFEDILTVIFLAVLGLFFIFGRQKGSHVQINFPDRELTFSLSENRLIDLPVQFPMTLQIHDEKVFVKKSGCPAQHCVKMGAVSRTGERIICVPNSTVIIIQGEAENGPDSITR